MLTLIGGKYTTHRSLAERVVDRVARLAGLRAGPCLTAERALPGGRRDRGAYAALPSEAQAADALEVSEAEVVHAVQGERARHLEDVLERAPGSGSTPRRCAALPGRSRSGWPRTWAGTKPRARGKWSGDERARSGAGDHRRALVTGLAPA